MIDLIFLIIGIICLAYLVISMVYKYKKEEEDWPLNIIFIVMCIGIIFVVLDYKEQCIDCGNIYTKYKVCCPQCGSNQSIEIKNNEEMNIDSVDINCNEVNIHKSEKKNVCDEVNEEKYCSSCGKEKIDKLQENQNTEQGTCNCEQGVDGVFFAHWFILTFGIVCLVLLFMLPFFF